MGVLGTRAFQDGLNRVLFPPHLQTTGDNDEQSAWRTRRILRRMREGRPAFVVVDVADDGSETVIGYAQWERPRIPDEDTHQGEPATEDDTPASLDKEALARLNETLDRMAVMALGPDGFKSMWCRCSARSLTDNQLTFRLGNPLGRSRSPEKGCWENVGPMGNGASRIRGQKGFCHCDS